MCKGYLLWIMGRIWKINLRSDNSILSEIFMIGYYECIDRFLNIYKNKKLSFSSSKICEFQDREQLRMRVIEKKQSDSAIK